MRKAEILFKNELAGVLSQHDDASFTFEYTDSWLMDSTKSSISLTLPKNKREFNSKYLFPFFYNMLPEGTNKQVICQYYRIDQDDSFGLLLNTAQNDSIGAVRILKIENK